MNTKNIIFSLTALSSLFCNYGMENSLNLTTHMASRPAPKKYRRLLTPPAKITPELLILETESFLDITSDEYETMPTENFITIEENFQKSFGYSIPTRTDDYKKTSFKEFRKNNNVLNTQEQLPTQKPFTEKMRIIIDTSLPFFKQEEHEKKIAAEKLRQEQEAVKEKLLREGINRTKELIETRKKLINELNKQKKIIEHEEKKQRIINAQKREQTRKEMQKKANPQQSSRQQKPENHLAQTRNAKKKVIQYFKCQTEKQVKELLLQECSPDYPCTGAMINKDTAFHYNSKTNTLDILIGKEQIENFDCCELC